MKIILFLSVIFCMASGCRAKYSEELQAKLASKKVPEEVGKKLKRQFHDPGKTPKKYHFHWDVYNELIKTHKHVYIVPIRYSKDDEQYYRQAWGLSATDSAGFVAGYSSFMIQVGKNSSYYQSTEFCPPPENCTEAEQQ